MRLDQLALASRVFHFLELGLQDPLVSPVSPLVLLGLLDRSQQVYLLPEELVQADPLLAALLVRVVQVLQVALVLEIPQPEPLLASLLCTA